MILLEVATKNSQNRQLAEILNGRFWKNGAKLSLMMFLTTFVPKKIGYVFANVDFHVNPHFAALCTIENYLVGWPG